MLAAVDALACVPLHIWNLNKLDLFLDFDGIGRNPTKPTSESFCCRRDDTLRLLAVYTSSSFPFSFCR